MACVIPEQHQTTDDSKRSQQQKEPIRAYLFFNDTLIQTVMLPELIPDYRLPVEQYIKNYNALLKNLPKLETKIFEPKFPMFDLVFVYESTMVVSKEATAIYRFAGVDNH